MAHADDSTYMGMGDGSIIGSFYEEECGNFFEFSHNPDYIGHVDEDVTRFLKEGAVFGSEIPHLVWVINEGHFMRNHMGGFRYARVLKTRAWVLVDEDEEGNPVWECWKFKGAKANIYDRRHYGEYTPCQVTS